MESNIAPLLAYLILIHIIWIRGIKESQDLEILAPMLK